MSKNEEISLQANFDGWREKRFPVPPKDLNVFEYYCIEQFLRSHDLSDSQLKGGLMGGSKDGGVDALYLLVNGELIDAESELDPKIPNNVTLLIMQVKEGDGFSPIAVDKLYWFTDDLLDLTRKKADYHTTYRPELVTAMRLFKDKHGIIVGENPPLSVEFYYITKKDVEPNDDCKKSAEKVKALVTKHFNQAQSAFHFVNAAALWAQVQTRPPRKKILQWASQPMSTQEGEIGLVRLVDYYAFIKDTDGQIAERFFDSNVRGYWHSSLINKRIAETLKSPNPTEFWLLNNGITILTEKTETSSGFLQIDIHDPQIVNGLQTSRQIYNHFNAYPPGDNPSPPSSDKRRVLVRIIKTGDRGVRDEVIRCTNSQNEMPEEALRATDEIHRQIETLFHRYGLFYDRRKGHYKDQGKPVAQIISVVELLQAMLAIVLKRPDDARGRPRDYVKKNDLYASVFGKDRYDLNIYLKSIQIMRKVEDFLEGLKLETIHRRNLPSYLCMYAACTKAENPFVPAAEIIKLDLESLSDSFMQDCYKRLRKHYERLAIKVGNGEADYDLLARGPQLLKAINADLRKRFIKKK